jgi:hypothetical protein
MDAHSDYPQHLPIDVSRIGYGNTQQERGIGNGMGYWRIESHR